MRVSELLTEDGKIVKGVNTTVDVGVDEIAKQAKKFGNEVSKIGVPNNDMWRSVKKPKGPKPVR